MSALNSALASCLITTTTGEVGTLVRRVPASIPRSWLPRVAGLYRPKSAVKGAASMARIITPRGRSRLVNCSVLSWTENSVWQNTSKTQRVRPRYRQGRSTQEDDDGRGGRTIHRGPQHVPSAESRVAAYVVLKMIQQSHAPMDVGEVEGEVESSDDQIDELRGSRRDERSTRQRRRGKRPWKAAPSG